MQAKTDPEDREPQVEIRRAVASTINRRPTPKDNPAAAIGNFCRRRGIGYHGDRDIYVPERPVDQVIELPEIIHHIDGAHCIQVGDYA
jgi:hypothetical protein